MLVDSPNDGNFIAGMEDHGYAQYLAQEPQAPDPTGFSVDPFLRCGLRQLGQSHLSKFLEGCLIVTRGPIGYLRIVFCTRQLNGRDERVRVPIQFAALLVDANEMGHGHIGARPNIPLVMQFLPQGVPNSLTAGRLFISKAS